MQNFDFFATEVDLQTAFLNSFFSILTNSIAKLACEPIFKFDSKINIDWCMFESFFDARIQSYLKVGLQQLPIIVYVCQEPADKH